jgi:hypothetical protein
MVPGWRSAGESEPLTAAWLARVRNDEGGGIEVRGNLPLAVPGERLAEHQTIMGMTRAK